MSNSATQPPCIAWAEKLALRREELLPDECVALDAHVAHCRHCRQAQADYHFFDAALKTLPQSTVTPFPRLSLLLATQPLTLEDKEDNVQAFPKDEELESGQARPRTVFRRFRQLMPIALVASFLICVVVVASM